MKQKNLLHQLAIAIFTASLFICPACTKVNGDGPVVSETRTTTSFSGINYAMQGNLHIESAPGYTIEIKAQQNILPVIETYISNNELFIRLRNNTVIRSYEPIEIYVKTPDPQAIRLSGSGNIRVSNPISPSGLILESSGSGSIELVKVETGKLQTRISGSGKIEVLEGTANSETISVSGSGQAILVGVATDSAHTQTSGSGDITVWVNRYLESEISGSGKVRYKGNPEITKRISGSGTVLPW
ncbi:head GIN domain-containing protein [Flavihumibacter fluvii]|uniref:head GIN domain-containing protein n=1 Tax=Flavihumibacter fluvii TaxID=2838157 RepID=UPI001BDE9A25|nr:head GIN domain-containing protein [Flavihumibacter fluvii]ULQ53551.1 DUF2807 domain-containing protein [Flavihumibacter fluvii]